MSILIFQIVAADSGEPVTSKTFASAQEAQAARPIYEIETGKKLRIAKVKGDDAWRMREASRLADGTYKPLPQWWQDAAWWLANPLPLADHYAHMSTESADMIAYTESAEKGARDIQTRISASRYLAKFFPDLRPEEISEISARFAAPEYKLEIGMRPEDFEEAYNNQLVCAENSNYTSCMAQDKAYYRAPNHPAYAYGAGDLGIAIFRNPDDAKQIMARAVVWPNRQTYVRLYGRAESDKAALRAALNAQGYRRADCFSGARMLKIERRGSLLVPYIDGDAQMLEDAGEYLVVDQDGDIDGENTSGWSCYESGSRYTCDHCGDRMRGDDAHHVQGEIWCESCAEDNSFYCEYYEESLPSYNGCETVIVRRRREQTWSSCAARNYAFRCERTDNLYSSGDFTEAEVETSSVVETWCLEANEGNYFEDAQGDFYSCDDFTHIEVMTADGTTETWCKEKTQGEYFICEACGVAHENALMGEDGMCQCCAAQGARPTGKVDDVTQMEIAL
jgi:hypothetical protein